MVELLEAVMAFDPEDKCIASVRVMDGMKALANLCHNTWIQLELQNGSEPYQWLHLK